MIDGEVPTVIEFVVMEGSVKARRIGLLLLFRYERLQNLNLTPTFCGTWTFDKHESIE